MKKYLLFTLFCITFFIIMSLVTAKDISECFLKNGTTLIIDSNNNVSKYIDGNFVNERIEVTKNTYFFFNYFELKYDVVKDKVPLKIQLPKGETLIHLSPTADRYISDAESGSRTISIIWETTNPRTLKIEYGNILMNFLRNLQYSLNSG